MLSSIQAGAADAFPRPAALEHDVRFWKRVYTEVDTKSGFIHDSENLTVVYETLQLGDNSRKNRKTIKKVKAGYATILRRLGQGKRSNLTTEEKRVLNLWGGERTSNSRFKRAAGALRFQLGQSNRFKEGVARSGEWNPYIKQVFRERGLPPELTILPHVESSFNPRAYSSAGAAGIWQFTRGTGRRFMKIDYIVDERMDPFAATVAAAQLLKLNYETTGTWPLALTAYNHGAASMRRATKQLGTTDITTIVRKYKGRAFGFASRNFYVSFLAALEVSSNPAKYYGPITMAQPFDYAEIKLDDYLLVDSFARAFGTNLETLKRHNRALMAPVWDGQKRIPKGYQLRIPKDQISSTPKQLLASIPASERFSEQTPDLFHKVVRGDTVSEIARRYGHSIRDVARMNGLNRKYAIRIGQTLRLPVTGTVVTLAAVEGHPGIDKALLASTAAAAQRVNKSTEPPPGSTTVKRADVAPAEFNLAQAGDTTEPKTTAGATSASPTSGTRLLADPADYSVGRNNTIEVQAAETLGHIAEWLDVRASRLRQLNKLQYGMPVVFGQILRLDFSKVSRSDFENRRLAFQNSLQDAFFMAHHVHSTKTHVVKAGESIWKLSTKTYRVPLWLLRQYNPNVDLNRVIPGTALTIPELVET